MSDLIFAVISPFFSSIATIFSAQATKELTPLIVTSIGGLVGSFILFSILLLRKSKIDYELTKKKYREILILTILRPLLGALVLAIGLSLTTGIKAIFFTKTEPYFVLFWYWILKKEKAKIGYLILLAIHIIGAIILSTGGNFAVNKPQIGDFLIILAMGFFSLSYFYSKNLSHSIGAQFSNAVTLGIAGIILLPFTFFVKPFVYSNFEPIGWLHLLIYVVLFNVIGLTLWFSSLKTVPGWIVSALRALGPILGAPIAYLVFKETLSTLQILGGTVVLLTSFLIAREHLKNSPKTSF